MTECGEICNIIHHFLHFDYIVRLTPFDLLEVKWLNYYIFCELHGCKDLGEVWRKHGYKLSRRRWRKHVLHLFRTLAYLFYILRKLFKPFPNYYEVNQTCPPLYEDGQPFHLFRRMVKPFNLLKKLVKPFYLFFKI